MDNNILETRNASQEKNPPIPSNWQFPEKDKQFNILKIEPADGSLSFGIRSPNRQIDYLFNPKGLPKASRVINIDNRVSSIEINASGGINKKYTSYFDNSVAIFLTIGESLGDDTDLGQITYSKGKITSISLTQAFRIKKDESGNSFSVDSPYVTLNRKKDFSGLNIKDWNIEWRNNLTLYARKPTEKINVFYFRKLGKLVYKINWEVLDGKIIVIQEHIKDGELKTLTAPIQIDEQGAKQAFFSRLPCPSPKEQFPWLKIGEIIGLNVAYSKTRKEEV